PPALLLCRADSCARLRRHHALLLRRSGSLPRFRRSCWRLSEVGKCPQDRIHFSDEFDESRLCASTCEVFHVYRHQFILTQANELLDRWLADRVAVLETLV